MSICVQRGLIKFRDCAGGTRRAAVDFKVSPDGREAGVINDLGFLAWVWTLEFHPTRPIQRAACTGVPSTQRPSKGLRFGGRHLGDGRMSRSDWASSTGEHLLWVNNMRLLLNQKKKKIRKEGIEIIPWNIHKLYIKKIIYGLCGWISTTKMDFHITLGSSSRKMKPHLTAELDSEWFLPFLRLSAKRARDEATIRGDPRAVQLRCLLMWQIKLSHI